jgi:hypothetical protein
MRLIAGNAYRVYVVVGKGPVRHTGASVCYGDELRTMRATMRYCGGSQVDPEGHHVAGGTWAKGTHPRHVYFRGLAVVGIGERVMFDGGREVPKRMTLDDMTAIQLTRLYEQLRKRLIRRSGESCWDFPTMRIVYPEFAGPMQAVLAALKAAAKREAERDGAEPLLPAPVL